MNASRWFLAIRKNSNYWVFKNKVFSSFVRAISQRFLSQREESQERVVYSLRTRRGKWSQRSLSAGCMRARDSTPRSCRYSRRECRGISPVVAGSICKLAFDSATKWRGGTAASFVPSLSLSFPSSFLAFSLFSLAQRSPSLPFFPSLRPLSQSLLHFRPATLPSTPPTNPTESAPESDQRGNNWRSVSLFRNIRYRHRRCIPSTPHRIACSRFFLARASSKQSSRSFSLMRRFYFALCR